MSVISDNYFYENQEDQKDHEYQEVKEYQEDPEDHYKKNMSIGNYVNVGNYLARPDANKIGKLIDVPLPVIEIHSKCKAFFSKKEYTTQLSNSIEIYKGDIIYLNIIIDLITEKYELVPDKLSEINIFLSCKYSNGVHCFEIDNTNKKYIINNATINILAPFIMNSLELDNIELDCVSEFKYNISLASGIKIKKRPSCMKSINISPYYGSAYISLKNMQNK
jgi:hypothetical protein